VVLAAFPAPVGAQPAGPFPKNQREMADTRADVWAEAALRQPGGPSYEFFRDLLPPLRYVDVVRQAYRSMCEVVAARIGGSFEDANTIVATAVDIRNCALYGLAGFVSDDKTHTDDIAVVSALPKSVFE
jgi:hypothetical protein